MWWVLSVSFVKGNVMSLTEKKGNIPVVFEIKLDSLVLE